MLGLHLPLIQGPTARTQCWMAGASLTLLFVYGTLKRGQINHHLLASEKFVATARTRPGFRLYELDGYPGLVPDREDHDGVIGEIWAVGPNALTALDAFEGLPEGLYRREPLPLISPHEKLRAEAYVYAQAVTGRRCLGSIWPSGRK